MLTVPKSGRGIESVEIRYMMFAQVVVSDAAETVDNLPENFRRSGSRDGI